VLTEAGLATLPYAERALESTAACFRAARGELGPPKMDLTIGTPTVQELQATIDAYRAKNEALVKQSQICKKFEIICERCRGKLYGTH
jgi:DNA-binding transcriptional LysR family regulator